MTTATGRLGWWIARIGVAVIGLPVAAGVLALVVTLVPATKEGAFGATVAILVGAYGTFWAGYGLLARALRPYSWGSSLVAVLAGAIALAIGGWGTFSGRQLVADAVSGGGISAPTRDRLLSEGYREARVSALSGAAAGTIPVLLGLAGLGLSVLHRARRRARVATQTQGPASAGTAAPALTPPLVGAGVALAVLIPSAAVTMVGATRPAPSLDRFQQERIVRLGVRLTAEDPEACEALDEEYRASGVSVLDATLPSWRNEAMRCLNAQVEALQTGSPGSVCEVLLSRGGFRSLAAEPEILARIRAVCPGYPSPVELQSAVR